MAERRLADHGCTRKAKAPELRPSQLLAMRRWTLDISGIEEGGRKISRGVYGFTTIVSASNQLRVKLVLPLWGALEGLVNVQYPFQSLRLWLRKLRDDDREKIGRLAPCPSRSFLRIILREITHELIRGSKLRVAVDIILDFVSLQSLMDSGGVQGIGSDCDLRDFRERSHWNLFDDWYQY